MNQKIIFNGKEYNSIEEMPPDARRAYEAAMGQFNNMFTDADQNGVPDLFENFTTGNLQNAQIFTTSTIFFDGKTYNNVEELPPEARQRYQQAFQDQNRDGIPDVFEQLGQAGTGQGHPAQPSRPHPARPPIPTSPVHTPAGISPQVWLLIAGVVIFILLVVVAGLVFILMR